MTTNPTPDPASVERTAKALFEFKYRSWKIATDTDKAYYRDMARAAITAAGTVTAGAAKEAATYSSTQATNCAVCGEHKHTPLRVDRMGGYVCLTCIDEKLEALLYAVAAKAGETVGYVEGERTGAGGMHLIRWTGKALPIGSPLYATSTPPEPAHVGGQAVYQVMAENLDGTRNGQWLDVPREQYEKFTAIPDVRHRTLYTTPPAERVSPEAVAWEIVFVTGDRKFSYAAFTRKSDAQTLAFRLTGNGCVAEVCALGRIEPVAEKVVPVDPNGPELAPGLNRAWNASAVTLKGTDAFAAFEAGYVMACMNTVPVARQEDRGHG